MQIVHAKSFGQTNTSDFAKLTNLNCSSGVPFLIFLFIEASRSKIFFKIKILLVNSPRSNSPPRHSTMNMNINIAGNQTKGTDKIMAGFGACNISSASPKRKLNSSNEEQRKKTGKSNYEETHNGINQWQEGNYGLILNSPLRISNCKTSCTIFVANDILLCFFLDLMELNDNTSSPPRVSYGVNIEDFVIKCYWLNFLGKFNLVVGTRYNNP